MFYSIIRWNTPHVQVEYPTCVGRILHMCRQNSPYVQVEFSICVDRILHMSRQNASHMQIEYPVLLNNLYFCRQICIVNRYTLILQNLLKCVYWVINQRIKLKKPFKLKVINASWWHRKEKADSLRMYYNKTFLL